MRRSMTAQRRPWLRGALLALALTSAPVALAPEPARAGPPPPLVVTTTADHDDGACAQPPAGDCTLREAITAANAQAGADRIHFKIPGKGVRTIRPQSDLPPITDPVTIDGYTQRGAKQNTLGKGTNALLTIKLTGSDLDSFSRGLAVRGGQSTIRGLVINDFGENIVLDDVIGNTDNVIEGNFLGTNAGGTAQGGASWASVRVDRLSSDNRIGGKARAARNLISGTVFGVILGSQRNVVEGNLIGTDKSGTKSVGHESYGIRLNFTGGPAGNRIAANTIAFNGDQGVWVGAGSGNRIVDNAIFGNDGLGIDLDPTGATANDPGDADTGANDLQNHPLLTSAKANKRRTRVTGSLDGHPNTTFLLQFFANPAADPGEGRTLLLSVELLTDGSGQATFVLDLPPVRRGRAITATATDLATGDTSEFSAPVTVKRLR